MGLAKVFGNLFDFKLFYNQKPLMSSNRHRPFLAQDGKEALMGELIDKIKGNVNEAIGKAKQHSDNPDTQAEGAAQELKGKAQQTAGKIKGALGDDI
ncbi:MAG: hypothetical protein ACJAWY_002383 [Sphingomonas echinoides]|jgi:uncharacterized protein YjbJ (UPF0337 family)